MSTATLEKAAYSTVEVTKATGLTYRRIDYWTRQGYIDLPEVNAADGSGTRRRWSQRQLDQFMVIAEAEKSMSSLVGQTSGLQWVTRLLRAMKKNPNSHAWPLEIGTITLVVRRP